MSKQAINSDVFLHLQNQIKIRCQSGFAIYGSMVPFYDALNITLREEASQTEPPFFGDLQP